jgi:hypothetical protein
MAIEINEFVGADSVKKVPKKKGGVKNGGKVKENKEDSEKEKGSK